MKKDIASIVFWFCMALIWLATTIIVVLNQGEWWRIALNVFVMLLSLLNAILRIYNYKKNK